MRNENLYDFLVLCSIPRIGSQRIRNLMNRFKFPRHVFNASVRELVEVDGIEKALAAQIKKGGDERFAEQQLESAEKKHIDLLSFWHPDYPSALKNIYDPPILLYVKGNKSALQMKSVAVVGTRAPSSYGKVVTERYVTELVTHDIQIVSGLARGIDTIAHQTTLKHSGSTIAVLGSGLDKIYPYENSMLAEHMCNQGAVISEFALGKGPDAMNFPRRNRIIAGMSQCTLVIEAGNKSGSLITADFALEEGRDVYAVPGNINNSKSLGTNRLIQQGAVPALDMNEIIDRLSPLQNKAEPERVPKNLSKSEEQIFKILSDEPLHIDTIATQSGLSTAQALAILLSLELKSVIKQISGKYFLRV